MAEKEDDTPPQPQQEPQDPREPQDPQEDWWDEDDEEDYWPEDDGGHSCTPEDDAWEIWLAEAKRKAVEDPNSWPPLSVPQTRAELLSILRY